MAGYLSETKDAGKFDILQRVNLVVSHGGPGPWRQALSLAFVVFGGSGITLDEYYSFGMWRKDLDRRFRKEFLPHAQFPLYNGALEMPSLGVVHDTVNDKLATERLLVEAGLPAVRTLAAAGPKPELADVLHLKDWKAISAWLGAAGNLPVFGKPRADSFARGSVAITGLAAEPGRLQLLNGRTVPVDGLASEMMVDYPEGYLFQPFHKCHADLRRHVGEAMASIRIVTLRTATGVEPFYAVLRIPAKKAMHDGDAFGRRVWGLIDLDSGRVVKLRDLRDPSTPDVTHWLDPKEPLLGFRMPHWAEAIRACTAAHDIFPGHGIIGWDVFLTDDGALINEANARPGHVYQAAAARGLRNPDMEPAYARALAHARAVNAAAEAGRIRLGG